MSQNTVNFFKNRLVLYKKREQPKRSYEQFDYLFNPYPANVENRVSS